jgi:ADP-ribose pyrophosphatase YjhB (NUDIX family)
VSKNGFALQKKVKIFQLFFRRTKNSRFLLIMKRKFIGWAWRKMPRKMRRLLVRLTQPSFTVSVGGVIFDEQGRVLLLNHVLRPASGWGVGGGFINPGEQPEAALKREFGEEVGVEIKKLRFLQIRTTRRHVEIIYRGEAEGGEVEPRSREILEAKWCDPDSLPAEIGASQRSLIKLACENKGD